MIDYRIIKEKSDSYYEKILYKNKNKNINYENIDKAKLYELAINLLMQIETDTSYVFKEEDYIFLDKYNINIVDFIKYLQD